MPKGRIGLSGTPVKITAGLEPDTPYTVQNDGNQRVRLAHVEDSLASVDPKTTASNWLGGRQDALHAAIIELEVKPGRAYWAWVEGDLSGAVIVEDGI